MAKCPKATHQNAELGRLLRLPEVEHKTGLRRSQIYRMAAEGEFPKPCKIGTRASAWVESEVSNWIASRIAQRETAYVGGKR